MDYKSDFYNVDVRKDIVREFTRPDGTVDDMMAGLHEIRVRMAEEILPEDGASVRKERVAGQHKAQSIHINSSF